MNPISRKLLPLVDRVKRRVALTTNSTQTYLVTRRDNILARPVIAALETRLRHVVSIENRENLEIKYNEYYHWIAGTEVTEVQERARFLESKLNLNRKEMRESRERLETVTESLRSIASELEHTRRGDEKHFHLRKQEHETIQEEIKLHKVVTKAEYQERETFTLLMNAVREAHETERNYNQRIKMISLIGAVMGPFIGYMFSARLNAMRFARMEDIINKKLEILSFHTVNAVREIHGLDPEFVSEPEKRGIIRRLLAFYSYLEGLLLEAYEMALTKSREVFKQLRENTETQTVSENIPGSTIKQLKPRPVTKDIATQATTDQPTKVQRVIVERLVPSSVDYANLPEFKSLMSSLQKIDEKQDSLKDLLIASNDIQDSKKIEVSVSSDNDETVTLLLADQQAVRKLLVSVQDMLKQSQGSFTASIAGLGNSIDNLSKKITNNSEIYAGSLEHSKIVNDIAKSLVEIKSNMETVETYYQNDATSQVIGLSSMHSDLSKKMANLVDSLSQQGGDLEKASEFVLGRSEDQDQAVQRIERVLEEITTDLQEVKSDSTMSFLLENVDKVTEALVVMQNEMSVTAADSGDKLDDLGNELTANVKDAIGKVGDSILLMHEEGSKEILHQLTDIAASQASFVETQPEVLSKQSDILGIVGRMKDKQLDNFEVIQSDNLKHLNRFEEMQSANLKKLDEIESEMKSVSLADRFPHDILSECQISPLTVDVGTQSGCLVLEDPTSDVVNQIEPLPNHDSCSEETPQAKEDVTDNDDYHSLESDSTPSHLVDVQPLPSSQDDGPVGYPGTEDFSSNTVYLYSAFVVISTVFMTFFK